MHCKGHRRDGSKVLKVISWLTVKPEKQHFTDLFTADGFDLDRSYGTGKTTVY